MKSLIKFTSLISLCLIVGCQEKADLQNSNLSIVGGTAPESQSYYAGLVYKQNHNGIMCGSSFISKRILITAAHCVDSVRGPLQVRVGMGDDSVEDQYLDVESIVVHENWNPQKTENDIALLKVEDYDSTNRGFQIKPIQFNTVSDFINDSWDKPLRIIGAGKLTSFGRLNEPDLKQVEFPYMPTETCKEIFEEIGVRSSVDDRNLCGGYIELGGLSACQGDSGGPLTVENEGERLLVGLTSWGLRNCAQKGAPQVYTRVSTFADWIKSNKKQIEQKFNTSNMIGGMAYSQKHGCYDHSFTEKTKIGAGNVYVELTSVLNPISYIKRRNPIRRSELLNDAGICQYKMDGIGNISSAMMLEGNEKIFVASDGRENWEAKVEAKTVAVKLSCFDADQKRILTAINNDSGQALIDGNKFNLRAIQMPRTSFTDDMIVRKCEVDGMSVFLYEVEEEGKNYSLATFQGEHYGKSQEFIFLMQSEESGESEADLEVQPDFIGTIKLERMNKGSIEIKNNSPQEVELYSWELTCNISFELKDESGVVFAPKRASRRTGFGGISFVYQHRFDFNQSEHGSIMPGESLAFNIDSASALENLSCSINRIPMKLIVE